MDSNTITTDRQDAQILTVLDAKTWKPVDKIVADSDLSKDVVVKHLDSLKELGLVRTETCTHAWRLTKEGVEALEDRNGEPILEVPCEPEQEPKAPRIVSLDVHPAANIFPQMGKEAFDRLVKDIEEHGQINPIELYDERILDGKNRYLACLKLGIEPVTINVDKAVTDPIAHVVSLNLHRRHLNESQRAMAAARMMNMLEAEAKERKKRKPKSVGENLPPQNEAGKSRDKAATLVKVSGRSVDHAKKVTTKGSRKLNAAVQDGKVAVSAAAKVAETKDLAAQDEWVDEKVGTKKTAKPKGTSKKRTTKPKTPKVHMPEDDGEFALTGDTDAESIGTEVRD